MRGCVVTVLLSLACCQVGATDPGGSAEFKPIAASVGTEAGAEAGTEGGADTATAMAAGLAAFDDDRLLAEPSSLALDQIGYAHEPATLDEHTERWHGVGLDALRNRDFDRAVAAFAIVVEHAPEHATATLNLASALAQRGDVDRASHAIARTLTLEFPHAWHAYQERPAFASIRDSDQHARLRALAKRLRRLHGEAREQGQASTIRDHGRAARWAQAGVRVGDRFVPLAPRAWASTALDQHGREQADQRVDAVYDPRNDVVINVVARGGERLRHAAVEVHDPVRGRLLGSHAIERDPVLHVETRPRGARFSPDARAWTDLHGRPTQRPEGDAPVHLRVDAQGIQRL